MNTAERLVILNRIRKFSRLMDSAFRIPFTPFRFGWDPIIGLVPGLGDLVNTAISGYLLVLATQFRLPPSIFGWMIFNIGLEFVVGTIPLIGDFFDAYFKSNIRNLSLLEKHLKESELELVELDEMNLSSVQTCKVSNRPADTATDEVPTPLNSFSFMSN